MSSLRPSYRISLRQSQRAPLPQPPPRVLALTKPVTCFGNSLTAGNLSGAALSYPSLLEAYVSAEPIDNEGQGGQTPTQIADRVDNTDPTIYDPGAGLTRAQQVAGHVILSMQRNAITSAIGVSGTTASILSEIARAVAALTSTTYAIAAEPNADVEDAGIAGWAQITYLRRELMRIYPTRIIDWAFLLDQYANGGSTDTDNLFTDVPPSTTRRLSNGTINSLHPGGVGNKAFAWDGVWPFLAGEENGGGWCPPFSERYLSGAAAATATTTAGAVLTAPFRGTPDSTVIISADLSKFAMNATTGEITCVASFTPTEPWYDITYQVTKGTVRSRGLLRLFIGASDTSCTDKTISDNAMTMPDSPSGIDAQKFSFAVGCQFDASTDGTSMYLLGNESTTQGITVERTTANLIRVIGRNSAGTTIVNLISTNTLTSSNGFTWVLVSCDLVPGTPTSTMRFNSTNVLSGTKTLTSGGTIVYSTRAVLFTRATTLKSSATLTLRELWMASDYVDWGVSARRDELFNSSTLAAVALPANGAINAIVPLYWVYGNDSDQKWGNNGGTAGPFCTVIRPTIPPGAPSVPVTIPNDGDWEPTDLGVKLIAWWNADDHGTSNMTDDGGGLISSWIDRIGGVNVTGTTTARPTWASNSFNVTQASSAGVSFNGTANCLTTTSLGSIPVGTTPGQMYVTGSGPGAADANSRFIIAYGGTGGGTQRRLGKNTSSTYTGGDGTTSTSGGTLFNWTNEGAVGLDFAATVYTLSANGTVGTPTTGATLNTSTTRLRIGASTATTAANFWLGQVRHIFITTTLTTAERQQLEGWQAWDADLVGLLPSTHPYKYARP